MNHSRGAPRPTCRRPVSGRPRPPSHVPDPCLFGSPRLVPCSRFPVPAAVRLARRRT
jgi:hypothetical protein